MFLYITSGVANPFSLLATFSHVIFSAPGAEQLSSNVGVCWYCISVNKRIANLVGRNKHSLDGQSLFGDSGYLARNGISQPHLRAKQ